jgi:hypothetical protein
MYNLDFIGDRLFGRALRLRVAAWVLAHEDLHFYQGEAVAGVGYSPSGVIQELDRLVELGMILRRDPTPGSRRRYYTRTDSPLWTVIRDALDAIEGDDASAADSS